MKNILFSLENLYSDDRIKHTTGKIFKFGIIYFVTETGADPETFRGCPSPSQKIDINK